MKPVSLCALLLLMLAASCQRNEIELPRQAALNTWEVEDEVFYKSRTARRKSWDSLLTVSFYDADTGQCNSLHLQFTEEPIAGRDYNIVYHPDTSGEVAVEEWQVNEHHSGSEDELGGTVQVRSIDGRLVFIATEIEVEHYTWVVNSNRTVSFNLVE